MSGFSRPPLPSVTQTVAAGSAVALTNGTGKSVASITLTPGTWLLFGAVGFIYAANTSSTRLLTSLSATDNGIDTTPGFWFNEFTAALVPGAGNHQHRPVGPVVVTVTVNTPYYLIAMAAFTVDVLTACGEITAVRIAP
jgi:hypothetical protein